MVPTNRGRGQESGLSSTTGDIRTHFRNISKQHKCANDKNLTEVAKSNLSNTLTPEGYIHDSIFEGTPNLLRIHSHEYHKHKGKFSSRQADSTYEKLFTAAAAKCTNHYTGNQLHPDDKKWYGNVPDYNENWPRKSPIFRIMQLNVNGFSFKHDNFTVDMYMQGAISFQADAGTIQEINMATSNGGIRSQLRKAFKRHDKHGKYNIGYIENQPTNRQIYQPGGVAVWANGVYASRVIETTHDAYGRWSTMTFRGKQNKKFMIISAYQTCKGSKLDGTGIASQQFRAMSKNNYAQQGRIKQRKLFKKDIKELVVHTQQKNIQICLLMDFNTATDTEEMEEFIDGTGLINAYELFHPNTPAPRTYFRGTACIDVALVSPMLIQGIAKIGYAPFYYHGVYDHRTLIIDFDKAFLFDHRVDPTSAATGGLSVNDAKGTEKYINTLKTLLNKSKVIENCARAMQQLATKPDERTKQHLIRRIKTYKTVTNQLMLAAVKKAVKKKPTNFYWSDTLSEKGQAMRYWNARQHASAQGDEQGITVPIPEGIHVNHAATDEEVIHEYTEAKIDWVKTKDMSEDLHYKYVERMIEKMAAQRHVSERTARKMLYNQESSKAAHAKQGQYVKDKRHGMIEALLVGTPNSADPTALTKITDNDIITELLLRRNGKKLTEANISPFSTGPLADQLDPNGECAVSTSIIQGTYDLTQIDHMDVSNKVELKMILEALRNPTKESHDTLQKVALNITAEDFKDCFSKKNEKISCGPSGITMPHWKAATEDDDLSAHHALLMSAPFIYGFSYKEWEVSVHCMLQKEDLPLYWRLRIIQLFEGDFNSALNLLFGRRQMWYRDRNGLNSEATFGGRKGKGCHQALARIQYTAEHSRIMRIPMALIDVDATGCFDRITGCLLSLVNQSTGMTQEAAACQAKTLHNMKHHVKTKMGVSKAYIERSPDLLLEGNGQGNSASVPGWHGHNELMHSVYQKLIQGCRIMNPQKSINFVQWLLSFVDDNKMLMSFDHTQTHQEIMDLCSSSLQLWEKLLNITGGALELRKCLVTVMLYTFEESYRRKGQNQPGCPRLLQPGEVGGTCKITQESGTVIRIDRQAPNVGERLLGVRSAADGSFHEEYLARLKQSRKLAGRVEAAPFDARDAWQVYFARYKPALGYPLVITTFTDKECDRIQSKFYMAMLPKIGFNRHMPRATIFGPHRYGGMNMMDMKTEQIAQHTANVIAQIRKNDKVGQTMRAAIDCYQLYLGIGKQFFATSAYAYEHRLERCKSPITYIWENLSDVGATLPSTELWTPVKRASNDRALMDVFIDLQTTRAGTPLALPKQAIWHLNACRLYLKITMLSDITTQDGSQLCAWALNGTQCAQTNIKYPYQENPPASTWKIWRDALHAAFLTCRRCSTYLPIAEPLNFDQQPLHTRSSKGVVSISG